MTPEGTIRKNDLLENSSLIGDFPQKPPWLPLQGMVPFPRKSLNSFDGTAPGILEAWPRYRFGVRAELLWCRRFCSLGRNAEYGVSHWGSIGWIITNQWLDSCRYWNPNELQEDILQMLASGQVEWTSFAFTCEKHKTFPSQSWHLWTIFTL